MPEKQHRLTAAERRRGQAAGAATKRRRRAEVEQVALERLAGLIDSALDQLEGLLKSDDDHVRFRVVALLLDRLLGRPRQAIDVGWPTGFDPSMLSDEELEQMHGLLLKSQPDKE